jgi:hypothetical protein
MRNRIGVALALAVAVSGVAFGQVASISGNMDADMNRDTTKQFPVTITIGSNGYKGPLEVLIDASVGLSILSVIVQPPVLSCGTEIVGYGRNFVDCVGSVDLAAGKTILITPTILALPDPTSASQQDWSIELGGDFLSGADVRAGNIKLPQTNGSNVRWTNISPAALVQPAGAGAPRAGITISFENTGTAAGTGSVSTGVPDVLTANASVPVPAGGGNSITITTPKTTVGQYLANIDITDDGGTSPFPILVVVENPPAGSPQPQPSTSRVDVRAPANCGSALFSPAATCTNPTFDVTLSNSGTGTLIGAFSSDKPYIIPPSGTARIADHATQTFTGSIDMTMFPKVGAGGSIVGSLQFTYLRGTSGSARVQPLDAGSGNASISISIVTTVPPAASNTPIPPLASRCQTMGCWDEAALFVAGVGHVVGSVGQFISDLTIYPNVGFGQNPSLRSLSNVDLYFTQLGAPSSTAVKATLAGVAPPSAASFGDVVTTVYGATQQLGTLQVRAPGFQPDEIVGLNVNVFNVSNKAGTYGTTLPVFSSYSGVHGSSKVFLTGLRKNATSHTNLYIQEVQGADIAANVDFFGPSGGKLGSAPANVPAFGAVQLGGNQVPEGTVSAVVSVSGGNGAMHAYATPVDDASGDTWTVVDWPRLFGYYPTQFFTRDRNVLIPVAGAAHGANNTYFRTDAAIMNVGTVPASGTFKYYNRTGGVTTKTINLAVLETKVLEDITTNFFGVTTDSVGFITYTADAGNVVITSRNYTSKPGSAATYGTAVPTLATLTPNGFGVLNGFGVTKGRTKRIGGVDDASLATVGAAQPGSFRSSLGLVEVAGKSATVQVTIYYNTQTVKTSTTEAASATYSLGPNGFMLIGSFTNNILADKRAALGDLHNVSVEFTVLDGDGQIVPFISSVDNGTGDSTFRVQ